MQLFVRDKKFYRTILHIAGPVILQSLITTGINMTDTLMLGVYGEMQISGASLANGFINIFHILCMGVGYGAAVLTAQYWGAKDLPALRSVTTIMLRIILAISVLFTVATAVAPAQIMSLYTPDARIVEKGMLYFRYSTISYIPMGITLTLTAVMRSVREVRIPLVTSAGAFLVNVFFNWVFIYGNLGAPELQIEGAALATAISRLFELAVIGGFFFFKDERVRYRIRDFFRPCRSQMRNYVKYAVPVIVSDAFLGLGNNMVAVIMGHMGAAFVCNW